MAPRLNHVASSSTSVIELAAEFGYGDLPTTDEIGKPAGQCQTDPHARAGDQSALARQVK